MTLERPTLHIIPGVSASGKTTMAHELCDQLNDMGVTAKTVIPYTTRPIRKECGEEDGRDYKFITWDDYRSNFIPQIRENPTSWDVSLINQQVYLNRTTDTIPDESHNVAILPVHLGTVVKMRQIYEARMSIAVSEAPIIVPNVCYEKWARMMREIRPSRDPESEFELQQIFVKSGGLKNKRWFEPTWVLANDIEKYVDISKQAIGINDIVK